jgi:hypothetical protein
MGVLSDCHNYIVKVELWRRAMNLHTIMRLIAVELAGNTCVFLNSQRAML